VVQDSDLGVNFFLDEASRGKSRAECCTELLVELNPDVEGDWWPKNQVSLTYVPTAVGHCRLTDQSELGSVRRSAQRPPDLQHDPLLFTH
jgi:hypothetical protein